MEGFDKLYTTREVGELLDVGDRVVQRWVRNRKIPAVKIGRSYLIASTDLREFIAVLDDQARQVTYTTKEVGDLLNVGHRAVQGWVRDGLIPAVKIGRSYLISHADLREFITIKYHVESEDEE